MDAGRHVAVAVQNIEGDPSATDSECIGIDRLWIRTVPVNAHCGFGVGVGRLFDQYVSMLSWCCGQTASGRLPVGGATAIDRICPRIGNESAFRRPSPFLGFEPIGLVGACVDGFGIKGPVFGLIFKGKRRVCQHRCVGIVRIEIHSVAGVDRVDVARLTSKIGGGHRDPDDETVEAWTAPKNRFCRLYLISAIVARDSGADLSFGRIF